MTIIPATATSFKVQFDASVSYGTPALTDQKLEFLDGSSVVRTDNIGLPPPANGKIIVTCQVTGLPENKSLTVRVKLIGPGGDTLSPGSDTFMFISAPVNISAPIIVV